MKLAKLGSKTGLAGVAMCLLGLLGAGQAMAGATPQREQELAINKAVNEFVGGRHNCDQLLGGLDYVGDGLPKAVSEKLANVLNHIQPADMGKTELTFNRIVSACLTHKPRALKVNHE